MAAIGEIQWPPMGSFPWPPSRTSIDFRFARIQESSARPPSRTAPNLPLGETRVYLD
jgi:hypothetical protein